MPSAWVPGQPAWLPSLMGSSPAAFAAAFPFHVVFDADMRVRQVGETLARLLPALAPGERVTDHFRLVRPPFPFDFASLQGHPQAVVLLEAVGAPLRLKGQMLHSPEQGCILFLCSPATTDIRYDIWHKLMANLTGSSICLILSQPIPIQKTPIVNALSRRAHAEALAVAAANGIVLDDSPEQRYGAKRAYPDHRPSLLQDYEAGVENLPTHRACVVAQLADFRSIPAHLIRPATYKGKIIYLYADPSFCGCLYVGSTAAYNAYIERAQTNFVRTEVKSSTTDSGFDPPYMLDGGPWDDAEMYGLYIN